MVKGFVTRLPDDMKPAGVDIVRCPPGKQLHFVCVSSVHLAILTHWVGGRAVRCLEDECECRDSHREVRPRGYVFGIGSKHGEVVLMEFTAACVNNYADYLEANGTLRGAKVTHYRRGSKPNGQLSVKFASERVNSGDLPAEGDLVDILCRIYDIRDSQVREAMQEATTPRPQLRKA